VNKARSEADRNISKVDEKAKCEEEIESNVKIQRRVI
jgi:hypothetical protein